MQETLDSHYNWPTHNSYKLHHIKHKDSNAENHWRSWASKIEIKLQSLLPIASCLIKEAPWIHQIHFLSYRSALRFLKSNETFPYYYLTFTLINLINERTDSSLKTCTLCSCCFPWSRLFRILYELLLSPECLHTPQFYPVSFLSLHSPWMISLIPMVSAVVRISFK